MASLLNLYYIITLLINAINVIKCNNNNQDTGNTANSIILTQYQLKHVYLNMDHYKIKINLLNVQYV